MSSVCVETRLAARRGKAEDATDDDIPSTSGRQHPDATDVLKVSVVSIFVSLTFHLGFFVLFLEFGMRILFSTFIEC